MMQQWDSTWNSHTPDYNWEMLSLNLSHNTDYPEKNFSKFPQPLQANNGFVHFFQLIIHYHTINIIVLRY
jgi:hypothetical protein